MPNSATRRPSGRSQSAVLLSMIFAVLVLLSTGLTTAIAQDTQEQPGASGQEMGHDMGGRRGMPSVDDQLKHLSTMLNLSEDAQAKLNPNLEDEHKQMQQAGNENLMSRLARITKMRDVREN